MLEAERVNGVEWRIAFGMADELTDESLEITEKPRRTWRGRIWRWLVRTALSVLAFLACYALFLLIGLIPVNRGFAPAADGVEVFLYEGSVHTDLIFPIQNDQWDWGELTADGAFASPTPWATHVAIGWGDRGFYLDTPTWAELKASTALRAMFWPSRTVMHVSATTRPETDGVMRRVVLAQDQYARLCEEVAKSFKRERDALQPIDFAYHQFDAFYEARGSYHCFYTCNSWAGDCLKTAGASTPLFTPLPGMVGMYLP